MNLGANEMPGHGAPGQYYPPPPKSEISFNLSEADHNREYMQNTDRDYQSQAQATEKEFLTMGMNVPKFNQPVPLDENTRKIESKDSMWKPAPIIGREMTVQHDNFVQN